MRRVCSILPTLSLWSAMWTEIFLMSLPSSRVNIPISLCFLIGEMLQTLDLFLLPFVGLSPVCLLYWEAHKRTYYFRCGLSSAEERGRITSLHLLSIPCLRQPKTACAAKAHFWLCPPVTPGYPTLSSWPILPKDLLSFHYSTLIMQAITDLKDKSSLLTSICDISYKHLGNCSLVSHGIYMKYITKYNARKSHSQWIKCKFKIVQISLVLRIEALGTSDSAFGICH